MRFTAPDIKWDKIKFVGFDLDGTLYDEFDFISQVYKDISIYFSDKLNTPWEEIYQQMILRWLDKGSSYPYIFEETLVSFSLKKDKAPILDSALNIFRNFEPQLRLTPRMKFILSFFKGKCNRFLVTDGSSKLQWKKIKVLEIENYILTENIFVSGDYGEDANKPSLISLEKLPLFKTEFHPGEVVFFGDRNIDKKFAETAGFCFVQTNHLHFHE